MKFYTRRRVSPVITIVSLVDILTMVLMFFVYTTTFKIQQPMVEINLPEVKAGQKVESSSSKPAILAIKPSGDVFLDGKAVTLEQLAPEVKRIQSEGRSLQLKGDTEAPFGKILGVFDVLKTAGVQNLPTMTQDKK